MKKNLLSVVLAGFCYFFFLGGTWAEQTPYQDAESAAAVLAHSPIAYYDCEFSFVRLDDEDHGVNGKIRVDASGKIVFFSVEGTILLDVDAGDEPLTSIPADSGDAVKWYNINVSARDKSGRMVARGHFDKGILAPGDVISVEMRFSYQTRKILFAPPEEVADHTFLIRYRDANNGEYAGSYAVVDKAFYLSVDPSLSVFYEIYDASNGVVYGNGYIFPDGKNIDAPTVNGYTINFKMPGGVIVVPSESSWITYNNVVANQQTLRDGVFQYCRTFVLDATDVAADIGLYNNTTAVLSVYKYVNNKLVLIASDNYGNHDYNDDNWYDNLSVFVPKGDRVVVSVITSTPDQTFDIYFNRYQ